MKLLFLTLGLTEIMKTNELKFTRDPVAAPSKEIAALLDEINLWVARRNLRAVVETDRSLVCSMANRTGLFSTCGSYNVAIHGKNPTERLAIITGNFGDWI